MNQSKNPEYQAGRVDIAVEQCGGVTIPPKNDDVIYEQPLMKMMRMLMMRMQFATMIMIDAELEKCK